MRRSIFVTASACAALCACTPYGALTPVTDLNGNLNLVRTAFNANPDRVRLVLLVSPTCPLCLRGASTIQADVLSPIDSKNLEAFVLWDTQLNGNRPAAVRATGLINDSRTHHYWDGSYLSGPAFQQTLGIAELAWDVYLIYAPGIRWTGVLPPPPSYWMHQLHVTKAPRLDGTVFAEHVRQLLA